MFQYHGTAIIVPVLLLLPTDGNSRPDLRWSPTGNDSQGAHRIGVPMNSRRTSRPVPMRVFWSIEMLPARSSQSSLPGGQAV